VRLVDYAPGNPNPIKFQAVRQTFTRPFDAIPAPDWEVPEPKHIERDARGRCSTGVNALISPGQGARYEKVGTGFSRKAREIEEA
jgi:hypothetical protein